MTDTVRMRMAPSPSGYFHIGSARTALVGWLFAREPVDAVLISAEWIAANGDVGALIGSGVIASAAAVGGAASGMST